MAAASPSPPALQISDVTKSYSSGLLRRRHAVLDDVRLELAGGRFLGLLGPNGSGKSTLLRIAAGVERPDRGSVAVFGRSVNVPAARRRLGFLPEGSPFPPELSARECLALVAAVHGLQRTLAQERSSRILELVGLGAAADRRLGRFSQGMLRRFGLAQAFLHEPELILLDEPTAGLDAEGFVVLDELFTSARARGSAVVMCSHALSDLRGHGEGPNGELAVLHGGRIVRRGTSTELFGPGPGDRHDPVLALYRELEQQEAGA